MVRISSMGDGKFLLFVQNLSSRITANPTGVGLVAGQATSLASNLATFSSALTLSSGEFTRTKGTVAAKNTARQILRDQVSEYAAIIQAFPAITAQQLSDLGLTVRDHGRSNKNAPALGPILTAKSVEGRIVRGTLRDATTDATRRKPRGAKGATIFIAHGPTIPSSGSTAWNYAGQTGKLTFAVQFGDDVPGGVPCYICAIWNAQNGTDSPAGDPITVFLSAPGASTEAAGDDEAELKIAA